jgi:SH2 domain
MQRNQSKCTGLAEIKLVEVVQRPSAPSEYTLTKSCSPENYRNFEFNGKLYSSLWPEKIDLLSESEQELLKTAPWFQAGLPRKISLEILLQQPPGSFLVRHSESHKKCFALSMRVPPLDPPKLAHYIIEKSRQGYMFRGYQKTFSSLQSLIVHHSVLKEQLPTSLIMPRAQDRNIHHLFTSEEERSETESEEPPRRTTSCFGRKSREQ